MSTALAAERLRGALDDARRGLIERDALVELVALAAVAGEHLLVIGPPGTAKSEAVRRVARGLEASYFEYLLGRFTEPSEIFGPVDLRKLREGLVETETKGMLPEAEVAFLDEVFLGSTAILNALLALLNERTFRRGHTSIKCPLRLCVGASNTLPEGEGLAAFADRFLLRMFVEPVGDPQLEELLAGGWAGVEAGRRATMGDLDALTLAAQQVEMSALRPRLAQCVRLLRQAGVQLSDRRVVKTQKLVAAAAALTGRAAASEADLWPIVYAVPTAAAQATAREVLREVLAPTHSALLGAAAEEASQGPLARAARLVRSGRELLAAQPAEGATEGWRLRVEGVAREIDAGFAPDGRPAELAALRAEVTKALGGDHA